MFSINCPACQMPLVILGEHYTCINHNFSSSSNKGIQICLLNNEVIDFAYKTSYKKIIVQIWTNEDKTRLFHIRPGYIMDKIFESKTSMLKLIDINNIENSTLKIFDRIFGMQVFL